MEVVPSNTVSEADTKQNQWSHCYPESIGIAVHCSLLLAQEFDLQKS